MFLQIGRLFLSFVLALILLSGCGSSNSGSEEEAAVLSGTLVDAPIAGLRYESLSQSGVTSAEGTFQYQDGESVAFYIGDFKIGEASARAVMSPLDLAAGAVDLYDPKVANLLRLLQSLDDDDDPDNGIDISRLTSALVSGADALDLSDESDLASLLQQLDSSKTLVDAPQALTHFQAQALIYGIEIDSANQSVEQQVIVGSNGLSGTWQAEFEVTETTGTQTVDGLAIANAQLTGKEVPRTAEDLMVSDVLFTLSELLSGGFQAELVTDTATLVEWQLTGSATQTPRIDVHIALNKIRDSEDKYLGNSSYTHADAVWIKHHREIHTIRPSHFLQLGEFGSITETNTVQIIPGPQIPAESQALQQAKAFEDANGTMITGNFQDTHASEYYIPAAMHWRRSTEPVLDDLQRYHRDTIVESWSIYRHDNYSDDIERLNKLILSGQWQAQVHYYSVNGIFTLGNTIGPDPINVNDVALTLNGLNAYLVSIGLSPLDQGSFWIPAFSFTEDHVSWTIHAYSTLPSDSGVSYLRMDVDFSKVN